MKGSRHGVASFPMKRPVRALPHTRSMTKDMAEQAGLVEGGGRGGGGQGHIVAQTSVLKPRCCCGGGDLHAGGRPPIMKV